MNDPPNVLCTCCGAVIQGMHHVSDADAALSLDLGQTSARTPTSGPVAPTVRNPFWPWYGQPSAIPYKASRECELSGCWYASEGYKKCKDHADGVCLLAGTLHKHA